MFWFIIILLLVVYIVSYIVSISKDTIINRRNFHAKKELSIVTYNIQRLPYLFRPNIDILSINADIICLQEDFRTSLSNYSMYKDHYNVFHLGIKGNGFIADSGLTVYSKLIAKTVCFIPFEDSLGIDSLVQKGFLVVDLGSFVLINTHLQSHGQDTIKKQIKQLQTYVFDNLSNRKVFITGDFNTDLNRLKFNGFKTITSWEPTHIEFDSKGNMLHRYIDGALSRDISVIKTDTKVYDKYADHLSVVMEITI